MGVSGQWAGSRHSSDIPALWGTDLCCALKAEPLVVRRPEGCLLGVALNLDSVTRDPYRPVCQGEHVGEPGPGDLREAGRL